MPGLIEIVIAVTVLFFLAVGGYYAYRTMAGPRQLEDIERLVRRGAHREALFELRKFIERDDRNFLARYLLAQTHSAMGEGGAAILEYRQCLKIARWTPTITEAAVRKAMAAALEKSGNLTEAKNEYLIVTQLDSKDVEAFYRTGELLVRGGMHQRAIPYLKRALELNPRLADGHALLGQAYFHQSAHQDARLSLQQAVNLKNDQTVAHYFLGLTMRYLGELEPALKELDKAERDPGLRDKAILAKGLTLIDLEAYPRAMQELDRGIKTARAGTDTFINLNYLLATAAEKSRDLPVAIKQWELIERLKPGFRDVREKLKQYQEQRTDDSVKDLVIAGSAQFENLSRKLIENMGHSISAFRLRNDTAAEALTVDDEGGRRQMRRNYTLFWILRDQEALQEKTVRDFHELMREKNAARGIVITAGEVSPQALSFASSRPIDIVDAAKLGELMRAIAP
ncbi:MAG: tetratricopeptide repeat protein [Leptospirales bacterium]|nr:tetratricopeptide repeat protein [Leptospirales bacterium]